MTTKSAPSAKSVPHIVYKPSEAALGDYVEDINGVKPGTPEVTLQCRHNPEDIWTHTPCTFALTRHPTDSKRKAYRRIE